MNEIKLRTANVPGYLSDALRLLFTGGDKEIEAQFPILMGQIKEVANQCMIRSKDVSEKYKLVLLIAQELNLAARRKQGLTQDDLEDTKILAELSQKEIERKQGELDRQKEKIRKANKLFE